MNKQHLHLNWVTSTHQTYFVSLDGDYCPIAKTENLLRIPLKENTFPGGEVHLRLDINEDQVADNAHLIIAARYNTAADILKIVLAADAARRLGFSKTTLILPYFPAARQDRVCNVGEPLTVKIFADMINGCGFHAVHILSPHSEVTPALLNNVVVHDELQFAKHIIQQDQTNTVFNIVCPDAGAGKRVGKIATFLANEFPLFTFNLIRCEKVRDVKDGSLKEFFVQAEDLEGRHTIIFDDVVAYGGTFVSLAKELKNKKAGRLSIFTAHADCEAGLNNLSEVFDGVYTTNSKSDYTAYCRSTTVHILPFKI